MGGKGVKIAIIIVAFASAGVIYYVSTASEPVVLEGESTKVDVICQSCNEHYQDTPEHLATIEIRSNAAPPEEGAGRIRRMARIKITYPCEKCGATTAVAAFHCAEHDKYYPAEGPDGAKGRCPDCP